MNNQEEKESFVWHAAESNASFGVACVLILIALYYFISNRRDRTIRREEREHRLQQDRQVEANIKDIGKRTGVIERKITRKKCTEGNITNSDKKNGSVRSGSTLSIDCFSLSSNASDTDDADNAENLCSVCLEPFLTGDEVAWSKDLTCHHCFHSDCLVPWLMKHGDCPVCRTTFFSKKDFMTPTDNDTCNVETQQVQVDKDNNLLCDDIESQFFEIHNGQVSFKENITETSFSGNFTNKG